MNCLNKTLTTQKSTQRDCFTPADITFAITSQLVLGSSCRVLSLFLAGSQSKLSSVWILKVTADIVEAHNLEIALFLLHRRKKKPP